jgi:sugar phosphate isomerase/epimerase
MNHLRSWGVCALVAVALSVAAPPVAAMDKIPDEYKINGFAVGCQAWSFNHLTLFDAIRLTHQAGGKIIELIPGQQLKPNSNLKFDHNATDEQIAQVKAECQKYHVLPVNYGVVIVQGSAQWRKVFEFARKMDLYGVTSEPNGSDMDDIEKLVKEFDIHFCIHDHPKNPREPDYKFWDPHYVLSLVKDRDPRMGSCADTGHWLTSGVDPVEALRILKGRVMSCHLKDRNKKGRGSRDVAWGKGVGEVKEILDELKSQNFQGNIDIEYENDMEVDPATHATKSFPAIKQSIAWIEHYGQTAQR